ncbi:uncharacterized protein LOC104935480 isoform X3 [Larimichthys crocea]|uniref:uncharacterized protein LOC104935480 isoform X3 n=1 Tax=Larimichthys crocea TaxID=215358 RepID=UPI000F600921|nr:uncharacterized protein LOC104935480 isoform X3 [Larimichthys crocea]
MVAQVVPVLLLLSGSDLFGLSARPGLSSGSGPDPERGRMELRRVRSLAAQPRYGECWARALEHLDTRCRDLTSESQSQIALRFTLCHLSSSGRELPSCPEESEVSRCTGAMDAVGFNTYTEFFTHTHSMCHFLQSEAWQSRAESTMYRLTESSAGVAEQLQSTRQMAEDLIDAQNAALQAQQEILNNGEELRVTLRDSTQGLRSVFSELSSVSREQQVALSELFNRVSFLQSFLLMETHSLSSCCYNAAALCTAFLITSTQRSSRARLVLLSLVCLNFYLEKKIYEFVMNSDHPEHKHMYRDPVQQSLQVLQQLRETQKNLQEALQRTERLAERQVESEDRPANVRRRREETKRREEECLGWSTDSILSSTVISCDITLQPQMTHNASVQCQTTHNASVQCQTTHNASVSPATRPRRSSSRLTSSPSPLVYSVLVEDRQPRYSLRSRRSETH